MLKKSTIYINNTWLAIVIFPERYESEINYTESRYFLDQSKVIEIRR